MKPIRTYKEHKQKPNEPVQGLGRSLAYSGLNYIFSILKNDEIYSEELEDGIIGIEAYVNEREKEIERLNNIINEFDEWLLGEQMMFYRSSDNERLIRYGETKNKWLELKGVDKEVSNDDVLDYLRKHLLILGEYIIKYNGIEEDSANGKTESWTIIRKIPLFEEEENQGGKAED